MARTLGSLVVNLGLNAAEFTTGLTKSEQDAKRFAASLDKGIKTAVDLSTIALASMATAATAAFAAIDQLTKQAGNFKDLEETTGANAEALASISISAKVAGLDMATLAATSIKLTKGLSGVDDESKSAGAAIAALGLDLKEFKALDPVAQLEAIAKALAGFEDGSGKTAVLEGIVKGGAQLLPFLKELEQAGGRQVILTQQQIELADEYADKQARAAAELNLYAQVAATQALPAITNLTEAAKDFIKELLGVGTAGKGLRDSNDVAEFANNAVRALAFIADAADSIGRIFRVTGNVIGATAAQIGALADGDLKRYNAIQADASNTIDGIIKKNTLRFNLEKRIADQAATSALRSQEDRGFKPKGKVLQFSGPAKEAKDAADRISEAQRYLDNLQKQIDRTTEVTAIEQARAEIAGGMKGLTPAIEQSILALARQIDAYKELDKWLKQSGEEFDHQVKIQRQLNEEQAKATNAALTRADAAQKNNERLRDEIAVTLGGEAAQKALAKAYADSAIAEEEKLLIQRMSAGASADEVDAINLAIDALREYRELLDGKDVAESLKKDAEALQDVKNMFADTFADAFTDIATGAKTAKEAFTDLANSIVQQITRIAAQKVANSLFGGDSSSGPDIFAIATKLIGAYLGAPSLGGGSGFSGGGYGEHFALGGVSRGGMAMVGENGPELVRLPQGARVFSNTESRGMMGGTTIVNNHFTIQGQTNRASEFQIAQMAGRGVARAGRR